MVRALNQVLRARRQLDAERVQAGEAEPPIRVEDIVARVGRPASDVAELLRHAEPPTSLDVPMDRQAADGGGESLADTVADEDGIDPMVQTLNHEAGSLPQQGLDELDDRVREVLAGRYGLSQREPDTLEVLAARLGLARERIRQIQQEALVTLKRVMARHGIRRDALF